MFLPFRRGPTTLGIAIPIVFLIIVFVIAADNKLRKGKMTIPLRLPSNREPLSLPTLNTTTARGIDGQKINVRRLGRDIAAANAAGTNYVAFIDKHGYKISPLSYARLINLYRENKFSDKDIIAAVNR